MIPELRSPFNSGFTPQRYVDLLEKLAARSGGPIPFRVAETPIFLPKSLLDEMAELGSAMANHLISHTAYLAQAQQAIPKGFNVACQTPHPHFLTADFALVRSASGGLEPKLVEIQAFPSVFAYQVELCRAYREAFDLPPALSEFLGGLDEPAYWNLLARTILGNHDPQNVVLTEVDPLHQKTFPDFHRTAAKLGIPIVDIATIQPSEKDPSANKLHYRDRAGRLIPIHRIYNRAIADEMIAKDIRLRFDLEHNWDVEWAGHPNWYFLISKFSIPWLFRNGFKAVPPAVPVDEFLAGPGRQALLAAGVPLPERDDSETIYRELLLKPLFSFAGRGIEFEPSRVRLEAIPPAERSSYLVQQRMNFEPTIDTPFGPTQAEIRILYMWPDGGVLTPALSLVRLGRGKMMGVDHNKNKEWVGGSAAFYI